MASCCISRPPPPPAPIPSLLPPTHVPHTIPAGCGPAAGCLGDLRWRLDFPRLALACGVAQTITASPITSAPHYVTIVRSPVGGITGMCRERWQWQRSLTCGRAKLRRLAWIARPRSRCVRRYILTPAHTHSTAHPRTTHTAVPTHRSAYDLGSLTPASCVDALAAAVTLRPSPP